MKKKFLMIVAFFAMTLGVSAQPTPPSEPSNPNGNPFNAANNGIRRSNVPVAPATLLLLGLGGAAAGTMVYRNTKNKKEE